MRFNSFIFLSFLLLANSVCYGTEPQIVSSQETTVQLIELASPLNDPIAEYSGMTWCGDNLILIPQYPERLNEKYNKQSGSLLYSIHKQRILDYLDGKNTKPIVGDPIKLIENSLRTKTLLFDGFEAGACDGDSFWFTIESVGLLHNYRSYLVKGRIKKDDSQMSIHIDTDTVTKLGSQSDMTNKGDEAMLLWNNTAITFHEVNDPRSVDLPQAQVFDHTTTRQASLSFPHLPFRLTGTTNPDREGRFWGINYKYSGDKFSRKSQDPLAQKYGLGKSHQEFYNLERLVEFQINDSNISLVDRAPIQLKMTHKEGRNWEGLARLDDRGLLLITDKHPSTLFGFAPF